MVENNINVPPQGLEQTAENLLKKEVADHTHNENSRISNLFNQLREQIRRSKENNRGVITSVSVAVLNKDPITAAKAVSGEFSSAFKQIGDELSSIKNEMMDELSTKAVERTYLDSLPPRIQDWARFFQPQTLEQQSLFDSMKKSLENGGKLIDQLPTLAKLGDSRLLEHLYEQYPSSRPFVVGNLQSCPKSILLKAIKDPNSEVRAEAFRRADVHEMVQTQKAQEAMSRNRGQSKPSIGFDRER